MGGTKQVVSRRDAVRQAQALVRKYVAKGRRLSDELSKERRKEAARETRGRFGDQIGPKSS